MPLILELKMAKILQWQEIPTKLSLEKFEQFVLPHLNVGSRLPNNYHGWITPNCRFGSSDHRTMDVIFI
jgi:hypothetical protein